MRRRNELALLPKSPLLITESADEFDAVSADEFDAVRDAFEQEIKPRGIIEQMYVHDISSIVWEILRLRRAKAAIINTAFRDALVDILIECLHTPGKIQVYLRSEAETLARAWFKDELGKKRVAETLNQYGFDEYAIEGEAIKRSTSALGLLDRMLCSLEARRNKALRCIGEYRDGLARQLRENSDRVIEGQNIPQLEHTSNEQSAAWPVASERQIAANRRNACKSTGPIVSGKGRASSNAYRHGLSLRVGASAPLAAKLEKRARKIAGNTDDPVTLERAREIVQAEHDLARVRQAKVALIERTRAFAAADRPEGLGLSAEAVRGLLLELLRLDRYERRAAAQRDRAVLDLSDRIKCDDNR